MNEFSKEFPRIMVDIDGTLTIETEGFGDDVYANRTPNLTVINWVRAAHKAGIRIILWSSRFAVDDEVTKAWLMKHDVPYHELVLGKPQYDLLIDDKSIHPKLVCILDPPIKTDSKKVSSPSRNIQSFAKDNFVLLDEDDLAIEEDDPEHE